MVHAMLAADAVLSVKQREDETIALKFGTLIASFIKTLRTKNTKSDETTIANDRPYPNRRIPFLFVFRRIRRNNRILAERSNLLRRRNISAILRLRQHTDELLDGHWNDDGLAAIPPDILLVKCVEMHNGIGIDCRRNEKTVGILPRLHLDFAQVPSHRFPFGLVLLATRHQSDLHRHGEVAIVANYVRIVARCG